MPVGRLVRQVADKHQVCTQRSWKRPYGVGLLVAGHDARGPHLYNTCPSGNYWEYKAMAIGARSQVRIHSVLVVARNGRWSLSLLSSSNGSPPCCALRTD